MLALLSLQTRQGSLDQGQIRGEEIPEEAA